MPEPSIPVFASATAFSMEWIGVGFKTALASGFGYWTSMNVAIQWMGWGILFHLLSTVACVWFLPNEKGARHIGKDVVSKGMALAVVAIVGCQPELQMEMFGRSVSLGAILACYFLCGEWTGFLVDMNDLGLPFPKWLQSTLQRAKDGINNADISSTIVSKFTSVSKQPDGSTKAVTNATTIITTPPKTESTEATNA